MGRNSRQSPKSRFCGHQPFAMPSSLPPCKPTFAASDRKLGRRADLPVSSSTESSSTVNPAAAAASSAEAFAAVRALQIISPRWSSRYMTQIFNECGLAAQLRSNRGFTLAAELAEVCFRSLARTGLFFARPMLGLAYEQFIDWAAWRARRYEPARGLKQFRRANDGRSGECP